MIFGYKTSTIVEQNGTIKFLLRKLLLGQDATMAAIDNLKTEIAALQAAVTTAVAEISAAIAEVRSTNDADVQAAADAVTANTASLTTAVTALKAKVDSVMASGGPATK